MKNFRGAALAAGVGTPESVPHESEQDSFDFKHRNSRTVLPSFRPFRCREDNVSPPTSSSQTAEVVYLIDSEAAGRPSPRPGGGGLGEG